MNGVTGCQQKPTEGAAIMNQAIASRQVAIYEAEGMTTRDIPGGVQMIADLLQALRQSTIADQYFIGWMNDIPASGPCPVNTQDDPSYQDGFRESQAALTEKKEFVSLWNPVAREFGLPTYLENSI